MNLASPNGISVVECMDSKAAVQDQQPLMWHKAYFDSPEGDEPLTLDMRNMGKGQVWTNGESLGCSEDIGQVMLLVNVMDSATLNNLTQLSVKLDVAGLPKDGNLHN